MSYARKLSTAATSGSLVNVCGTSAETVGCRSGPAGTAACKYKSAWRRSSIQMRTVSRKLPTMIPTATSIAIAVDKAPTSTDVRRRDPARLRDASSASTPKTRNIALALRDDNADTSDGTANADAPINNTADI